MSNNNFLTNGLPQVLFVDGERPSATKFNSLFNYLNLNLMLLGYGISNLKGTTDINYRDPFYINFSGSQKVDLNILSIGDIIGPASSLNPRSYENISFNEQRVTEDIDSGISQHTLAYECAGNITINDYVKKNSLFYLKTASETNSFFFDEITNSIIFKQNTSQQLSVTYEVDREFRKFSYLGAGFNVVPHPSQAKKSNQKLTITTTGTANEYTIALPIVTHNQSNVTNSFGVTDALDDTNGLYQYQIEIPRFIWEAYNPVVSNSNVPSNIVALKCLDTGEVFDKASYEIIDKTTVKVKNLGISADCLEDMSFVLLFAGASNITMNIDDLQKKMGRHTHDGSFGEERIDIKNISGIFYTQDETYKYYPSNNIPLNHMPQYLHRNGWNHNSDSINDDNIMHGKLVLADRLIFGRPTNSTIDKPSIYLEGNTLNLNNNNKNLSFFDILNFNLTATNLYLTANAIFQLKADQLFLVSDKIKIGDTADATSPIEITYEKSVNETYFATNSITKYDKVDGNSATPIDNGIPSNPVELSDGFQKAKEEKVSFKEGEKTATSVLRNIYKNNSPNNTANYIIESKNNLPDFIVNNKIRSGKLSAETTKTIILNCIPTRTATQIPDGDNHLLPEYLIAQGELTDKDNDGFWDLEFPGPDNRISDSVKSCPFLYNLSAMNIQSVLKFNNKLRERLEAKTIPWANQGEKYPLIAKLGQTYFALVKREKFLTDDAATYFNTEEEAVKDEKYAYNRDVNEVIRLLDTTKPGSRDHLEKKFYLRPNNQTYSLSEEYETRKASEKYDCFYESDLTYMPIKWKVENNEFKNPDLDDVTYYNSLTIDDIDSSTELRLIELRELETLNHPYSLGSGNNGFFLPDGSTRYLFEAFDETEGIPTWLTGKLFPMRHTSTSWFRESFPLVRITNSKTNIINIDHAHNVDIINRSYNVNFPKQTDALLYHKTWSLGGAMKGALGHLLFRTQMITAMVDVDHVYLSNDTEYKYEININSKISPLHYSDDEDGVYNIGTFFDQPEVGLGTNETGSFDGDNTFGWPDIGGQLRGDGYGRIYNNYTGLIKRSYDYFYDQRNQSSSTATYRNYKFEEDDFTVGKGDSDLRAEHLNRAKPIYEGPCVKLIVRDVDHYVLKAIPCQMAHDSENNLEILNTTPQTYRLGFKDATHIKRDAADKSTKEFNGVFFYNYSSCGFFHERFIPTNTATSNLAVMTNSDALVNLQSTTEYKINVTNQPLLTATRRIPSYACLNNSRDIAEHTSFSWDDIVITNTSDLQIKVTVKEEFVPYYQSVSLQRSALGEDIYAPQTIDDNGESTSTIYDKYLEKLISTNANKNPLSANILPQGYKKVKVAYIETNNQLYYKCNDHRFMAKNDDTANESIPDGVNAVYANNAVEDRHKTKDLYGQNKFGMRNAYLGPEGRSLTSYPALSEDWLNWVARALRRSRF